MPFHVDISRGMRRAREFNLDEGRLRREILAPWSEGRAVQMGDREWDPRECELRIIEGPALTGPDLAFGRGWDNAKRSGRNATRELVALASRQAARVAVLAQTASAGEAVRRLVEEIGLEPIEWVEATAAARRGSGQEGGPRPVAVILAVEGAAAGGGWLFEAGIAVGALAGRAIVAELGGQPGPPELEGLTAVRVYPGRAESVRELAQRLGQLGLPVAAPAG